MKVFPDKLEGALAKKLPPVVIVAGDEPLQHMEACDAVRHVPARRGRGAGGPARRGQLSPGAG